VTTVVLEIADNGRGISAEDLNKPKSFGLRGISASACSAWADRSNWPRSPQGTRVIVLRAPLLRGRPCEERPEQ
jgi:two-component system sensor histidine kinase UhpB